MNLKDMEPKFSGACTSNQITEVSITFLKYKESNHMTKKYKE